MILLFVISAFFVVYTYLIYPAGVMLLARRGGAVQRRVALAPVPIAVIVPAYNEQKFIAQKIQNILAADYPPELLRVIVVCDAPSDDTVAQARKVADPRVQVIELTHRSGKVEAINRAVAMVNEPILVLTDAGEMLHPRAIRYLVENFSDPALGAVSGDVAMIDLTTGFSRNLGLYWRYESAIREAESKIGSMIGVCGPLYAIRRECFRQVPPDTILDDVAIPLEVIRQGRRVALDARAFAYEHATQEADQEFVRKRRTLAGNFQLVFRYADLLVPFKSPVFVQFLSHKVFRLFVPYALLGSFMGSWFLPDPAREIVLVAQFLFYGLAGAAFLLRNRVSRPLLTLPYTFCMLNWAALAGSYHYIAGLATAKWEKVK